MASIARVVPEMGGLHLTEFRIEMASGDLTRVQMEGIVTDYSILRALQTSIFEGGGPLTSMRVKEREYFCLYCASPNAIVDTHCKKCGAPRGFLFGP